MTATECAVSQPGVRRAPSVPGPFAADGRAVHCRGGMVDPDRPRRPALRAAGRHTDLHRLGSRPRSPHPPPMPRSADGRAEDRCRPCRRHQRTTAPTAQPRPIIAVVRDHNQPQPRNAVPAHAATVRSWPSAVPHRGFERVGWPQENEKSFAATHREVEEPGVSKRRSGCASRPGERTGVLQAAVPADRAEVPLVLHAV